MKILNRSALRLRAKKAFFEWCASIAKSDAEELAALKDQLEQTGTVYLIQEVESEKDFIQAVTDNAADILENELSAWCVDRSLWPDLLNAELLDSWFSVGTELMCFDLSAKPLLVADASALGDFDDGEIVEEF